MPRTLGPKRTGRAQALKASLSHCSTAVLRETLPYHSASCTLSQSNSLCHLEDLACPSEDLEVSRNQVYLLMAIFTGNTRPGGRLHRLHEEHCEALTLQ